MVTSGLQSLQPISLSGSRTDDLLGIKTGKPKTVARHLLENTINGDRIFKEQLDKCITTIGEENSVDHAFKISFESILPDKPDRGEYISKTRIYHKKERLNFGTIRKIKILNLFLSWEP